MPKDTSAFDALPPAAWAGLAFTAGAVAGEALLVGPSGTVVVLVLGAAAALAGGTWLVVGSARGRRHHFWAALLVLLLVGGLLRAEAASPAGRSGAGARSLAGLVVLAEGTVAADPRPAATGYEVLVEVSRLTGPAGSLPAPGRLLVRSRVGSPPGVGDHLTATGRLRLPSEAPGFDRRAYLAQRGTFLELAATQVNLAPAGSWLGEVPARLRAAYREAIATVVPAPHAAVLVGVVLGVRAGVPHRLEQDLVSTGLVHLLVLSGLKVAVFARLAAAALEPLLGRWSAPPVVVLIAVYALVGGATPAAVRAAAMGVLALVGARLGRPAHVWTSLALTAAAMAAWDPSLVFDTGFQLSFLGTAAIVLLTPPLELCLQAVPAVFREPLAVTAAAQVGTLPVTVAGFHLLSPVAPFANALTLPLLPVLVVGGLLLAPVALAPEVGRLAALPLDGLLAYLEQVAGILARVPGGNFPVPELPAWTGVAYYAAVGGGYAAVRTGGRRRLVALALAAGLPLLLAGAELVAWSRAPASLTVLDVGDGQALLAGGPGGWVLIDGGPSPARLADSYGRVLPPWTRHLNALFITAPGAGHVGGLAGLPLTVGTVYTPVTGPGGEAARSSALGAVARGARLLPLAAGTRVLVAGLSFQVLAPEAGDPVGETGAGYLALRVSGPGGHSFCDLSDLDPDAQRQAVARLRGACDGLLLPAAARSLPAPELLARCSPGASLVISAAAPHPARGLPPQLRRTDQEGSITFPL